MRLAQAVVVVTGAASGIGRALCERFGREGARAVVAVDRDGAVGEVARRVGGVALQGDVASEAVVATAIERTVHDFGRLDLFCSNAGISLAGPLESTTNEEWQRMWDVNLMAHVYAARHALPVMVAAGGGYLLHTASAAGLLSQIGSAPYSVTKHAVVAFAEWLAITYGDRGITVSCLCPQGVRTPMLEAASPQAAAMLGDSAIPPERVADAVVEGLAAERFLILPHPEVADYVHRKASDYDRWLRGMRRWRASLPD
jgi:NAD(P)-dependent dehydrogenase (short-subunit alcohol dehydrogenase family)